MKNTKSKCQRAFEERPRKTVKKEGGGGQQAYTFVNNKKEISGDSSLASFQKLLCRSFTPCRSFGARTQISPGTGNALLPFTAVANIRLAGSALISNEISLYAEQSQAGHFLGQYKGYLILHCIKFE